jgi:hypothetical protein
MTKDMVKKAFEFIDIKLNGNRKKIYKNTLSYFICGK